YIKADIEGFELEAIASGKETLKHFKPKMNIAAYHRFSDIFEIPLLIDSLSSGYRFYLRKHPYIPCWDLNYYVVSA
ncbi:MAG: FkbM family methyltransferase, partial [Lachnospiraceae bacterium]|nr:FkbM family methyltransferase [Lachnospiraceae bacterium]